MPVTTLKTCKHTHQNTHVRIFVAALFIVTKNCKQPKCPLIATWVVKYNGIVYH